MIRKVLLKNIKNIAELEFIFPNDNGVYLLTGKNGIGKTTLLSCLSCVGTKSKLTNYFKSPGSNRLIDVFKGAKVEYHANNDKLIFEYRNLNWSAGASSSSEIHKILKKFGFTSVLYIKADGNRIEATIKELSKRI